MDRYFIVKANIHTDLDAGDASTHYKLATVCLMSLLRLTLLPKSPSSRMNRIAPNIGFLTQYSLSHRQSYYGYKGERLGTRNGLA